MMKIETIVGDVVLLVLQDVEGLKEMGIQKNKIYDRINLFDLLFVIKIFENIFIFYNDFISFYFHGGC